MGLIKKVFDCIPENGTPKERRELLAQLVPNEMCKRTMEKAIKSLIKSKLISELPMRAKRKGRSYKRSLSFKENESLIPHTAKSLSEILIDGKKGLLNYQTDYEQTKYAFGSLFYQPLEIILMNLYDEMIEYKTNSNREEAKIRLNSVLKDLIAPMFMEIAEKAITDGMVKNYKEPARIAFEYTLDAFSDLEDGTKKGMDLIWDLALKEHKRREKAS